MTNPANGHARRRARKSEAIMQVAKELFSSRGMPNVSMDDISEAASVSKMTVYKYFGSKENLVVEIIKSEFDKQIVDAESVVHSDADFIEKMRQIIGLKSASASFLDGEMVAEVLNKNSELSHHIHEVMGGKIQGLMASLFAEGREKGFLDPAVSDSLLLTYVDIFRRGMQAKADDMHGVIDDPLELRKLIDLYFFGLIRPRPNTD